MLGIARRIATIAAWCGIGALAFLSSPREASAQVQGFESVSVPGCNASSLSQIPGTSDLFVGRQLINTSADPCSGSRWKLVLLRFDWANRSFSFVKDLISPPANGISLDNQRGTRVNTTYDASLADINGELWMVFECAGSGGALSGGFASSCAAPVSRGDYSVDLGRMTAVVVGVGIAGAQPGRSASVPKIFVYQGIPYLYWTAVEFKHPANADVITRIATRGAQLSRSASGLLWVAGMQAGLGADQGDEVLGASDDGLVGGLADGFDVKVIGDRLLLTSGAGQTGCATPISPMFGCYHLQIRTAASPLGYHVYNASVVNNVVLPPNPQEYSRLAMDPSGAWYIIGAFGAPFTAGSATPASTVPTGMGRFPVNPAAFQFGSHDIAPAADPQSSPFLFAIPYAPLQAMNLDCRPDPGRPGSDANSCASAAVRYCTAQGYEAGIMNEYNAQGVLLVCFRGEHVKSVVIPTSELTNRNSACVAGRYFSDSCASAIGNYCNATGYAGGGFGPEEYTSDAVKIACVDGTAGNIEHTTFDELSTYASCPASGWTGSGPCFSAVHRACMAKGYAGGYGILDHFGNQATMGCAKPNVPR